MSRYGLAGRMVRSPLNPLWSMGQGIRAGAGVANGMMPAAAEFGDKLVDQNAGQLSGLAGDAIAQLLPKNPGLANLARQMAPDAAKLAGRAAYMGGVGMANNLADTLTLENTTGRTMPAMFSSAMASLPQKKEAMPSSLEAQIEEDSARIKAMLAAGKTMGEEKPSSSAAPASPEKELAGPPQDEYGPTINLRGATVGGGGGGGSPGPTRVQMPPTGIDIRQPQETRYQSPSMVRPDIQANLDLTEAVGKGQGQALENAKKVATGGSLVAALGSMGIGGSGALNALRMAGQSMPAVVGPKAWPAAPPAAPPARIPLPGGNAPALPMSTARGPINGGIGSGGRVPLPPRMPPAPPPVTLAPQNVAGPLTPHQLQRLQDVINSNPRLMQLVQMKGGRVDPALRRLIESQVQQRPLETAREYLRNQGARPQ